MTMAESWSFKPYDNYKSTRELIHMLADVVAKGGNLLLNVGADGEWKAPSSRSYTHAADRRMHED